MKSYFLCALLAAGCGGSSGVNVTKVIGSTGGTVAHSDGTSVTVPMGALAANANITITSVDAPAPAGTVLVGPAYDFGPDGTVFAQPVVITLPFQQSKIPAGRTAADIKVYTAPRGSTQYVAIPFTLASSTVSTLTSHFTVYLTAVATVAAGDLGRAADLGQAGDMSIGSRLDMSSNCTPECTTGTISCGCMETCNGHTYVMSCSQSSSLASCGCEVDGQTQSSSINGVTCDDLSAVEGGFFSGCAPPG